MQKNDHNVPIAQLFSVRKERFVIWFMGPTSCGKTTVARHLLERWRRVQVPVIHFDGDEVRDFFGDTLDFSPEGRLRVVRTLVHLSNKARSAGLNVIVSALTANEDARAYIGSAVENMVLTYLKCSIDTCASRDPKGLYKKAMMGEIDTLIGYNSRYTPPENADIVIDTEKKSVEESIQKLETYLFTHANNNCVSDGADRTIVGARKH